MLARNHRLCDFLLTSFYLKLTTMKKTLLLIALATLATTVNVDAQSKSSQLNSGGRTFSSSQGSKITSNRPSSVSSSSSKIGHSSTPKMRVGASAKPTGPNHSFRKDEDFRHNSNANSGGTTPVTPAVQVTLGRPFDIGPSYQLFSDYSYMARYRNNPLFYSSVCLNCVFPVVSYTGISSYNSQIGEKVMALTNTTEDTLFVEVAFINVFGNSANNMIQGKDAAIYRTAKLVPGQTYYFLQYEEQFRIDVYRNERAIENLVNQYSGNCSPTNIYLSLTADQPN